MDCHRHAGTAAVGLCRACGRGLCPACAHEYERGLACRDRCEAEVAALIDFTARSMRSSQALIENSRRSFRFLGWFLLTVGGIFAYAGLFLGGLPPWVAWIGAVFGLFGLIFLAGIRRIPEADPAGIGDREGV